MIFCFNAGEIFQVAVEIEKNGLTYYKQASRMVADPEMRELFTTLAEDEVKHRRQFEDLLAELPDELKRPTVSDIDHKTDLYIRDLAGHHVFGTDEELKSGMESLRTVEDALELALRFEKDSVIFYLGLQEVTCEGKARDVVSMLVKEEQEHVRRLSAQIRKCSSDVKGCLLNWPE